MRTSKYDKLFATLSNNLDTFILAVKNKKSTLMATDEWTVKDVLCHITFWHENYAANYRAMALGKKPPLLNGPGYRLNKEGVSALRRYSEKKLIDRLRKAHRSLYKSIVEKNISKMTYKEKGRVYRTAEFLQLLARHFVTHTKQVKRAK